MAKYPSRRTGFTVSILHTNSSNNEDKITITANMHGKTGKFDEVFVANPMVGSDMEAIMTDGCIMMSLLLQNGITIEEIVDSLGDRRKHAESEAGEPTSHFGAIARAVKELNDEFKEDEETEKCQDTAKNISENVQSGSNIELNTSKSLPGSPET